MLLTRHVFLLIDQEKNSNKLTMFCCTNISSTSALKIIAHKQNKTIIQAFGKNGFVLVLHVCPNLLNFRTICLFLDWVVPTALKITFFGVINLNTDTYCLNNNYNFWAHCRLRISNSIVKNINVYIWSLIYIYSDSLIGSNNIILIIIIFKV